MKLQATKTQKSVNTVATVSRIIHIATVKSSRQAQRIQIRFRVE